MILITLGSLAVTLTMTWWVLDSLNRRWTGAGRREQALDQTTRQMVENFSQVVAAQTTLTEHLLLGRPLPASGERLEPQRTPGISLNPDEAWRSLPDHIQQAMAREAEEASTWPTPSEMLAGIRSNGAEAWVESGEDRSPSETP